VRGRPRGTLVRGVAVAVALTLLVLGFLVDEYYLQSAGGQLEVLRKSRPIADVVRDPRVSDDVRERLELVVSIRQFAVDELGLPDSRSFTRYADLERDFVVWNVFVAPALSMDPVRWCFPVAGCVPYRGYFSQERAYAFAAEQAGKGFDVHVGGVPAYSTLGWLPDPVLNTYVNRHEVDLAALIFHELAHEQYYLKGDAVFNESFATAVEREGARRWLAARGSPDLFTDYLRQRDRGAEFVAVSLDTRRQLAELYRSELDESEKLATKARLVADLEQEAVGLRVRGGVNNARLAAIGSYHGLVPAFEALLVQQGGDLPAFYDAVRRLGEMPRAARTAILGQLAMEHSVAAAADDSPLTDAPNGETPDFPPTPAQSEGREG